MSALTAPTQRPDAASVRQLRLLPSHPPRLARIPFLVVLGVIVALGMVGVLVLSVTIQQQGGRLDDLNLQTERLADQQASLQAQLDSNSSTTSLVGAAYAMGMRPNPTPAFIQLSTGRVIGTPTRVTGQEMGDQVPATVLQQASAIAAARAASTAKPSAQASSGASAQASTGASSQASGAASTQPSGSTSAHASSAVSAKASAAAKASGKPSSAHSAASARATGHTGTRHTVVGGGR